MNQTGPRNYISLTSSAALHIAAAGLMVCGVSQVVPQVAVDSGGHPGFVASISTTVPPPIVHASEPVIEVVLTADLPNPSLNKAAVQTQPRSSVLSPTVVRPPSQPAEPNYNGTSFQEFTNRPGPNDLLHPVNEPQPVQRGDSKRQPRAETAQHNSQQQQKQQHQQKQKTDRSKSKSKQLTESKAQTQPPQQKPPPQKKQAQPPQQPAKPIEKPRPKEQPEPATPAEEQSKKTTKQKENSRAGNQSKAKLAGTQVDQMPRKLAGNAAPEYPADAYRNGDEGLVYLLVEIGATGTVSKVTVYRTSGFASLDEAARKAVIQWKKTSRHDY